VLAEPGFEACRVLVAGKAFARYTRDLLIERRLEERVRYLGWCAGARLDAFYDAIDVLVQPSTYEPFGLAALEAAARGIPIVCTAVDGLVEVLGDAPFYCDDTGFDAFCAAMRRWRAAPDDELAERTAIAHRRARAAFTDTAMAERYRRRFAALAA
jgi:glycosyltransferase involved in cell wall biosynthesis